ncbi:hypothetical protein SUGI_0175940 [Cryptomeria japonica]|nr:hypothetical protein SUGI_0175940 [Cryptomeria japonica]
MGCSKWLWCCFFIAVLLLMKATALQFTEEDLQVRVEGEVGKMMSSEERRIRMKISMKRRVKWPPSPKANQWRSQKSIDDEPSD